MAAGRSHDRDRAQTAIDFAIGVALLLLAVTIVFAVLPGMNRAHVTNAGQEGLTDRVGDRLVDDVLTTPDQPTDLNETCTERFFNGTAPRQCPYDRPTDENLTRVVGVNESWTVNVTVERNGTVASLNTTGNPTQLAVGNATPTSGVRVLVARRSVLLNDTGHRLFVRVW